MAYKTLEECLMDLERTNQLVRIREEVDPYLEMAAIHLRVHEMGGPAVLYENVKGGNFRAASNIYGTVERGKFIFRDTFQLVQQLIELKNNPAKIFTHSFKNLRAALLGLKSFPLKTLPHHHFQSIKISDVPLIHHWKNDGGAFITLPQVYTEDIDEPGIKKSNLGMYRVQLNGNDYVLNEEVGLHYQLHRGIGIHQTKTDKKNQPLKVSCFVGGPPAHAFSAVMPLPEDMSEILFAGILANRRFRYFYEDGFCMSADADFIITGKIHPHETKPEGPFGDHLGYYSLQHSFPFMHVHKVYAKKNAICPFTVVGRPPQEDTIFGTLIHELTGDAVQAEIPGLKEVHAVDAAGVHPLLLALGSERYTPYNPAKKPAELLTIANHILGTGQLSLAKFLFITAETEKPLSVYRVEEFLTHILERIDLKRDVHFYTNTTMDTLDYSGMALNAGSKVVFAAYGEKKRELCTEVPDELKNLNGFENTKLVMPGVVAVQATANSQWSTGNTKKEIQSLNEQLKTCALKPETCVLIILCDDAGFLSSNLKNFLWATFTRCNPSHDIYGIGEFIENKHWGCTGPLIIDSRIKPHHAPVLEKVPEIEKRVDKLFDKGGSLYHLIK